MPRLPFTIQSDHYSDATNGDVSLVAAAFAPPRAGNDRYCEKGRRGNGHEDSNRMAVVHQRSEAYWHQNAGKVEAVVTKPNTSPNEPGGVTARTIMSRESIAMAPA